MQAAQKAREVLAFKLVVLCQNHIDTKKAPQIPKILKLNREDFANLIDFSILKFKHS